MRCVEYTKISASILAANILRLGEAIGEVEKGGADILHVDVTDGHFTPNITFGSPFVEAIKLETTLPVEAHLMISKPEIFLNDFIKSGADSLILHVETCGSILRKLIKQIKEFNREAGVALNPNTSIKTINGIADDLDLILIMSVNPGFNNQKFNPEVIPKIRELQEIKSSNNLNFEIAVDGGVNQNNAPQLARSGVTRLVVGSGIFYHQDINNAIRKLRASVEKL